MTDNATDVGAKALRQWDLPIGFWERFRIRCAGLFDRMRTRKVSDDRMTHYLIALQERAQGFQVEVLKWVSAEDIRLEAAIESQRAVVQHSNQDALTDPPSPPGDPGDASTKKDRARWATAAREHDRALAETQARRRRQAQAEAAILALRKERQGLSEQRDINFAACQQWFDERAALYNRARTGWFGLPSSAEHMIPVFRHIEFAKSRPGDFAQIGDGAGEEFV